MSSPRRMGLALALAAMVPFTHVALTKADETPSAESAAPALGTVWYTGGTLHKTTASQWLEATSQNQLATASDWVLTSKQQQAKVAAASGDMSLLLSSADKLRQCINGALRRHADLYSSMP